MTLLPAPLRAALDGLAEGRGRGDLARRSQAITAAYRARRGSDAALNAADDALAYALARMPATYAAAATALARLMEAMPDLAPRTLLDAGCGPGTASFAAAEAFPSLERATLIDRNGPFLDLARRLAPTGLPGVAAEFEARDLAGAAFEPADVVVAGYVLAELSEAAQAGLAAALWRAARCALVLVEPGTPDGFLRLKRARAALLAAGAHAAAPCTHEAPCPMAEPGWCRFLARVQRSRDHRLLKGGERPFEDEPYAYLALTRDPPAARAAHRIVGRPSETKGGVTLPVCGAAGLGALEAPRRDRERSKRFSRLRWGDAVSNQGE